MKAKSVKRAQRPVKTGMRARRLPARPAPPADALNQAALANLLITTAAPARDVKLLERSPLTTAVYGAAPAARVNAPKEFFGGRDDRLTALTAPGVYRVAAGSHTTILLYVGSAKVRHVPMDAAGLEVVVTEIKRFRAGWVAAPYPVAQAATRYLRAALHLVLTLRARAALEAVASGGDEAAVKLALNRALPEPEAQLTGDLANGLRAAGRANGGKRGGNLPKSRGIGAWVCDQLLTKVPDEKILKEVVKKFPGAKTNAAHLAWYRGKLKREGRL